MHNSMGSRVQAQIQRRHATAGKQEGKEGAGVQHWPAGKGAGGGDQPRVSSSRKLLRLFDGPYEVVGKDSPT